MNYQSVLVRAVGASHCLQDSAEKVDTAGEVLSTQEQHVDHPQAVLHAQSTRSLMSTLSFVQRQ